MTSDSIQHCPQCGSPFTHLTRIESGPPASDPSRADIEVTMVWKCEVGHEWVEHLTHQEGVTRRAILIVSVQH